MLELKNDKEERPVLDTRLKYQYLIDAHNLPNPCPNKCKPDSRIAYRFVCSETITDNDFLPTEIEYKNQNIKRKFNSTQNCMQCAISLFDTADNAISRLKYLSENVKEKFSGKLIAVGTIEEVDGLASEPDYKGHFSFYEYINTSLYSKFDVFNYSA